MQPLAVRLHRHYGAGILHLAVTVAALALAGYAVLTLGLGALWNADSWWQSIAVWFAGAAIAHDLLLYPAYTLADRLLAAGRRSRRKVRIVNHVRVPLLATGLTFLVFFPGIVQQGSAAHLRASGLTQDPYLERWLLLSAGFFAASGVVYAVRKVTSPTDRSGHEPGSDRVG